jgi:hypothetical protein
MFRLHTADFQLSYTYWNNSYVRQIDSMVDNGYFLTVQAVSYPSLVLLRART